MANKAAKSLKMKEPQCTIYTNAIGFAATQGGADVYFDFCLTSLDYPTVDKAPILARVYCNRTLAISFVKMIYKHLELTPKDLE